MILATALPLGIVAAAILVPLVREYIEFRREWGLSRAAALLVSSTIFPSLGIGLAAGVPLLATPPLQWLTTVIVTIAVYSLATAALRPTLTSATPRQPR